jgi:hypothetical protein
MNDRQEHYTVGDALMGLVVILAHTWPFVFLVVFATVVSCVRP